MKKILSFILMSAMAAFIVGCDKNAPTSVDTMEETTLQTTDMSTVADQSDALAKGFHAGTYEITLYNLTPATGAGTAQPLSPAVIATHRKDFDMFHHNGWASTELQNIAEQGDNSAMLEALENAHGVFAYTAGDGPVFPAVTKLSPFKVFRALPNFLWL